MRGSVVVIASNSSLHKMYRFDSQSLCVCPNVSVLVRLKTFGINLSALVEMLKNAERILLIR